MGGDDYVNGNAEFLSRSRVERRADEVHQIEALRERGYKVVSLTPYQFRVNDRLDLYPTRRRFHNLRTNQRGAYVTVAAVVSSQLERGSDGR